MKLMAVFLIGLGEQSEMHLLTYRMRVMYTGLVKTSLFFQNMNAYSDLNFWEFFEAISGFFTLEFFLLAIISRNQDPW